MKYIKTFTLLCVSSLSLFSSCLNNDYLEKYPLDQQTENTAFVSYENFKTYSWGLYEVLGGYDLDGMYGPEAESDNMFVGLKNSETKWAWQKVKVPEEDGGWDYSFIRRCNLMLDNIEDSELQEFEKAHWRGVGLFFRSFKYFELLSKFGDIVWVEHTLNSNSEELYAPRDSRDLVADNILRDLKYAEENIKEEGDGANTINPDVVRALISRFTLFEGTWRKYHGLKDSEKYLMECKRVSSLLISKYPNVHPNYDEVFNSKDLGSVDGILLYKQYELGLSEHMMTRLLMSASSRYELCKDAVDSYLCKDGKTIANSDYFEGFGVHEEFRNRDLRLLFTVCPPYKVNTPPTAFTMEWWHTDNPLDQEYFDVMERISSPGYKVFPIKQNGGNVLKFCPHFTQHNGGFGFQVSEGGYWCYKHLNHQDPLPLGGGSSNDAPLFRMGEVMLNYAEAMWKLGEFTQEIADATINKLRIRAEIAPMIVNEIDETFDSTRDLSVAPVLWEIRRERRVELMGDGFRFNDLRRWKKCEYINKQKLGRWLSAEWLVQQGLIANISECKLKFRGGDTEGFIEFFGDPVKEGYGWKDHYYLYPLPLNDLALNPNLKQNPGYE